MSNLIRSVCLVTLTSLSLKGALLSAADLRYDTDVRPILAANCFACHGADAETREADLRLDTADGAANSIVPGKPDESELILRIESDDVDELMPPPDSGHRLTAAQKMILRQ